LNTSSKSRRQAAFFCVQFVVRHPGAGRDPVYKRFSWFPWSAEGTHTSVCIATPALPRQLLLGNCSSTIAPRQLLLHCSNTVRPAHMHCPYYRASCTYCVTLLPYVLHICARGICASLHVPTLEHGNEGLGLALCNALALRLLVQRRLKLVPSKALVYWIPAFAGMTEWTFWIPRSDVPACAGIAYMDVGEGREHKCRDARR
jgi:hypothetical protein